ncbi:MAG: hypothetical protein R2697_01950 [Ilumatobacteraceae bacterium]
MIAHPPVRDGDVVTVSFDDAGEQLVARFRLPPGLEASDSPDVALAAGWLPAMRRGVPLHVDGEVSPRLASGASRIAEILLTWDRDLHDPGWYRSVPLVATPRTAPTPSSVRSGRGRVACFFTGGVDSFHSVVQLRNEIDALVFVHGFDLLDDWNDQLNRRISERLHEAASMLGLPLIEVESNLAAFGRVERRVERLPRRGDGRRGTSAVAGLLQVRDPGLHHVCAALPAGLAPDGRPLWSSEELEIVHHGADSARTEKLRAVADDPASRRHLRVCFENRDGATTVAVARSACAPPWAYGSQAWRAASSHCRRRRSGRWPTSTSSDSAWPGATTVENWCAAEPTNASGGRSRSQWSVAG